ncbi:Na+/H+ antiporter subunit E [Acinetobacter seifertii]|uniref:Na+/H+ antiporter subunit E n=1 Tax=Acinetobacter seifertii TaxID=1530123 RepID=UPI000D3748F5|nr:Na+/H+ antiporter subunit E [Acinetobacter seifertii]PTV54345.1 Na+/H+ antiporter subunit E [Acinetobacter seifertii]
MQLSKLLERWFPHPFVSLLIIIFWLMLSHSLDASDLLMAVILGLVIPRLVRPFITRTPHIHWQPAIKLFFVVLWDIVISNFRVAKLVLGPPKKLHPKWYRVPLETEHEQVNSLLAMIITTTPGTVSAGIDQERGDILVHSLSTENTESDVQDIKQRYEAPLMEIFDVKSKSEDNI